MRMYVFIVITYSKGKGQPGKVTNPPRGHLNLVLTYGILPEFRGGVHSLLVHIMHYKCIMISVALS